jgi:aspartate aminotransferase
MGENYKLSQRVKNLKPSPTLATDAKAKLLKCQGVDIINFSVGEPDFDTPQHIKEAAYDAIRNGFTKYTAVDGIPELKKAIIQKFREDTGLDYKPTEVMVSTGGKQCLYNIFQAIVDDGDEVIIPVPYWVSYPPIVELAGGMPVYLPSEPENGFALDIDKLKSLINYRTKAIILNSPSNPTGMVYSAEELMEIAKIAIENKIFIVTDDIYDAIRFDGKGFENPLSVLPESRDWVIMVNGVSKTCAMTGWRIGFMGGPERVVKACSKIQSQSTSNPNSIAQKAALAGLTGPKDFIFVMCGEFKNRRDYILKRLNAIEGLKIPVPQGAFYAFVDVSSYFGKSFENLKISDSLIMSDYLLEKGNIAVVAGAAFGDDRFIRFSYATSMKNIEAGMDRFEKAIKELR